MDLWKKLPLSLRLYLPLISGIILIFLQMFFFNIWIMLLGMVLHLVALFSLQSAPSEPYTSAHKIRLFYAPMVMAIIGAVTGFFLYKNTIMVICTSILAAGIYSMFVRQILLSFGEMRVYKGVYAFVASSVFCSISLFMIMMWMLRDTLS